jgi:TolB-like protein
LQTTDPGSCVRTPVLSRARAPAEESYIIAVIPFENRTRNVEYSCLGDGIMESVITDLLNVRECAVVNRDNLEEHLAEVEISHSDLVDSDTQLTLGEELADNTLIRGNYQVVAETILINDINS